MLSLQVPDFPTFQRYAEANGYKDVQVKRFKTHDRVTVHMTPRTGWPGTEYMVVTLKCHVEELKPSSYHHVAMSLDERDLIHCSEFLARCMALESGLPYRPTWYSEKCDRCGRMEDELVFPYKAENPEGKIVERVVCRKCDHEIINGGNPLEQRDDVWAHRQGWR